MKFLVISLCCGVQTELLHRKRFFFIVRECKERVSPSQSQQKGSGPAHWALQCPNCEWASFFSTANNKKADSPPSSSVCAPTAKRGWNKGQWRPDHTRQMFEGSPPLAWASQDTSKCCQVAKVLFTYSSNSLLVGSSFSFKDPLQDEDESF